MKYIVLCFSFSLISLFVSAQTWKELNDSLVGYYKKGEYDKGISVGERAVIAAKKQFGEGHADYARSINNLALLYNESGQYEKAEPLYLQAKKIWKKNSEKNDPGYATCLNNLAELYKDMGQYEKAEPLYIESMNIRKETQGEKSPSYASSLNNLAGLYRSLGQYEKSTILYIQANEIKKNVLGENHPSYATSLNNLASLYEYIGLYEKAEPLYIQAIDIRKKIQGEKHPDYAFGLTNLGVLYQKEGLYEKAEPLLIEAVNIFKNVFGENHPAYATSLNNMAVLYHVMGNYKKAEPLYIRVIEIRKKLQGENHPNFANDLDNLAGLYESMGQLEKAEPLIIQSNQITLKNLLSNFAGLSEKEKGNYLTNNLSLLEINNSFIYKYPKSSSALLQNNFNLQLVFKSLTLADTKNMLVSIQQSNDAALLQLLKEWQASKSILAKQYSSAIADRRSDLKELEAGLENLEKELSRKSSEFRNQQNANRISLQDVQKKLEQDEVAIEFVSFNVYNKKWTDSTMYAAYVLNKNDLAPVFVPLFEEKQLQQLFDRAGNTATTMVSSFYRGLKVENKGSASLGKELYQLIWQRLEPYLKGVTKISYSPAGKLYSIAFQALHIDSTTVLMDKYQLQQYTSTRQVALRNKANQTTKPTDITLFGNANFTMDSLQLTKQKMNQSVKGNVSTSIFAAKKRSSDDNTWNSLPGTAEEVNSIKQLFDKNKIATRSFTQTTASEENLKALSSNSPQILHIATHGFFLPEPDKKKKETGLSQGNAYTLADDPLLRSGLILSGGNYVWSGKTPIDGVEDGIATAYEISQLNLSNTELVVLSACETALGDVKGSEGVFGLQRAFKIAGVKKLIVSLWQVPDKETAELMTTFYGYWMKGKTINESFTQAQADMRKKYSPFYWAAFVLVE